MVNRALGHAALMDAVYRRQRHAYDLTRRYFLFGRDRAISDLQLGPGARLVEVGCGTARNLVRIARRYPEAKLFGVDASAEILQTASHALARAGLSSEVRLAHGGAEALSPAMFGEAKPFDAILFSYSLSMIPDWKRALAAADSWLRPDGRIHVVDFGDTRGLGRFGAWALRAWLALFHVSPRVELLRSIETKVAPQAKVRLRLLPGRYAFILAGSKLACHGGR
jgi:S-adenosylmethionine-diacylgycerolhomoserine-N-methlytransferase